MGQVTIDSSDWYINLRMIEKIKAIPGFNLMGYRDYFLNHIWNRTKYYDELAKKVIGNEIIHTLLLHDNMLNALFLKDLIQMYRNKGWEVVNASLAYKDPIYNRIPITLPVGESLIWALAKQTGKYEDVLRYPGEDSRYEKPKMDHLGL